MKRFQAERWIGENQGPTLLLVGAALVGIGVLVTDAEAVATAMVSIGALAMVLAVLLPRMEGSFKVGPGGLEGALAAVEEESEGRNLEPEQRAEAVARVLQNLSVGARGHQGMDLERFLGPARPAATTLDIDALAVKAVEDVTAMVEVSPEDVPTEALRVIKDAADLDQAPVVNHARRRPGAGAPRWQLWTDAGEWQVSNTRHGWSSRRLDP